MGFERKEQTFVGGPYDGMVIEAYVPKNRECIYVSGIKGDSIYLHRGVGFHRYYRFMGVWRWEKLDRFDTLLLETPDARCSQ